MHCFLAHWRTVASSVWSDDAAEARKAARDGRRRLEELTRTRAERDALAAQTRQMKKAVETLRSEAAASRDGELVARLQSEVDARSAEARRAGAESAKLEAALSVYQAGEVNAKHKMTTLEQQVSTLSAAKSDLEARVLVSLASDRHRSMRVAAQQHRRSSSKDDSSAAAAEVDGGGGGGGDNDDNRDERRALEGAKKELATARALAEAAQVRMEGRLRTMAASAAVSLLFKSALCTTRAACSCAAR